jgi:hypothetical protein
MTVHIIKALSAHSFGFTTERDLQDGIAGALAASGVPFEREAHLSASDVPDFMCGRVAVEVKIKGSLASVTRQLHRYAQHAEVDEILLVTTRAAHTRVARSIGGKAVSLFYISIQNAF